MRLPLHAIRIAFLLPFASASAQFRPSLVADLEPGVDTPTHAALPSDYVAVGSKVFFPFRTGIHMADLRSGTSRAAMQFAALPRQISRAGKHAMINYRDTLWFTDCTERNTWFLRDRSLLNVGKIVAAGELAYFVKGGSALWVTDGTESGTREIGRTPLENATPWGNKIVFQGKDFEPWISDGTASGTFQLAALNRLGNAAAREFTIVGDRALFVVDGMIEGTELFSTDGTTRGTRLVADLVPGPQSSNPRAFGSLGERAVFTAVRPGALYVTDGHPAGTRHLLDLPRPGLSRKHVDSMTSAGDRVFFVWATAAHGRELWTSDGTVAGTHMVLDINPGQAHSAPTHLTRHNNGVVFLANSPSRGREIWASDGTAAGTRLLHEFERGPASSTVQPIGTIDNLAVFAVLDRTGGMALEFWTSDGTPAGTQPATRTELATPKSARFGKFATTSDGRAFFSASTKATGNELWITDGTTRGTRLVVDLAPGPASSSPHWITAFGKRVLFTVNQGTSARWISDGTPRGTIPFSALIPANLGTPGWFFPHRERLCFSVHPPSGNSALWETDGTPQGTRLLQRLPSGGLRLAVSLGDVLVVGLLNAPTTTLYRVDESGIQPLARMNPRHWFAWNDRLFLLDYSLPAVKIWVCDGTANGTRPFDGFGSFSFNSDILYDFVVDAGKHFYLGDPRDRQRLWVSDGTESGTRPIKHDAGLITSGVPIGTRMLFGNKTDESGTEPWITDGADGGTHLLRELAPSQESGLGNRFRAASTLNSKHAIFSGFTPLTGHELWVTDGTTAGTKMIEDFAPGAASSSPEFVANLPSGSLFLATHPVHGRSLWRIDGLAGSRRIEAGCNGGASRTPQLTGTGSPVLGGRFALDLKHGVRHAPGLLMVGEHPGSFPLGGYCRLVLDPNRIGATIPITTDHLGRTSIPFNIPTNAWLHGRELRWQAAVSVRGTPNRLSLTNGLATALSAW